MMSFIVSEFYHLNNTGHGLSIPKSNMSSIGRRIEVLKHSLGSKPLTDGMPVCKTGLEYENNSGYCIGMA